MQCKTLFRQNAQEKEQKRTQNSSPRSTSRNTKMAEARLILFILVSLFMTLPSVQAQINATCSSGDDGGAMWPWLKDASLVRNITSSTSSSHSRGGGSDSGDVFLLVQDPPLPPLDDLDTRPAVRDLLALHQVSIERLRKDLSTDMLYEPDKHDALWMLRFVLSHKDNHTAALDSARETLLFRVQYRLDETDIRGIPFHVSQRPALQKYLQYCSEDAVLPVLPDMRRGVVMFLRMAGVDAEAVYDNLTEQEQIATYLYQVEWTYQWLDYVTRTTGRLTKSLRIVDCQGYSLSTLTNRRVQRRNVKIASLMDSHYPQLLGSLLVVNASPWIHQPWRLLRPLFPKRFVEKVDFIDPSSRYADLLKMLRYASKGFLPVRFGGLNKVWPLLQDAF